MSETIEANIPPSTGEHVDESILKKRGRFRRVNSDPMNISSAVLATKKIFGNDPLLTDSTTAELLCCLATSSSASYDFDDLRSEVFNKAKAQRLKSRSKDDSEMNLQTASQDTFVGRFLQDKRSTSDSHVFLKNHNFSAEDENYLLSLLPSISVDTNDIHIGSSDRSLLRREFSELSDTADLLQGLSGSYDINQSIGMSGLSEIGYHDLMPPPIMLPSHLGSSSMALDSGRTSQAEGIAYAFPTRTLPKKSPSLYMSPARMPLSKAATLNHSMLEQKKMEKEKSLTSAAALNEFGMIQVAPTGQPPEEVATNQSQSVSDISTVPSGSLASTSSSGGAVMQVSDGSSGGSGTKEQHSPPQHYNQNIGIKSGAPGGRMPHRSSKSLSQIDSASGDPSAFDALLQHFRNRSDSQRSLNSSSWSINSGISSMSIGDLTKSNDAAPHQHIKGSKNYPRLVQMLTAASTDEMEESVTMGKAEASKASNSDSRKTVDHHSAGGALHNSHAASHGGHHNVNSHIVHHHFKDSHHGSSSAQKQKAKHHELLKRQDGLSPRHSNNNEVHIPGQSWLDSPTAAALTAQQQAMMGGAMPVTTLGADNTPYTTYYVPVTAAASGYSSGSVAMDPSSIEYTYSSSNGGTPRNGFPGNVSVTSESYSYNNGGGGGGMYCADDSAIAAAMSSLSYSQNGASSSSSSGSEHLNNPALNSYVANFNSAGGYFATPVGTVGYGNFNQNSMASSNTLNYLAEIKGENNLYKEKAKPQRYVGRSNYRCGKCGMPKVNHVCSIVDTLITGVEAQTMQPSWDPKAKPVATERVLTISKRNNITEEFDYDEHHNRFNITQPRRDIFAKKQAQQQAAQRQLEMQQLQAAMSMYSSDGYSPTNYQQQLMYQELLARTRSNSTLFSSSQSQYSSYNSTPTVTPTAATMAAKMALNSGTHNKKI